MWYVSIYKCVILCMHACMIQYAPQIWRHPSPISRFATWTCTVHVRAARLVAISPEPSKHATCRRATPRTSPQNSQSLTFSSFSFFSWKGQLSPFFCFNLVTYYLTSYHHVLRIQASRSIQHLIIHLIPCIYIGGSASHRNNLHCAWQQHSSWKESQVTIGKAYKMMHKSHWPSKLPSPSPRFAHHQTMLLCKLQPCGLLESKIQVNYEETIVQRSTTTERRYPVTAVHDIQIWLNTKKCLKTYSNWIRKLWSCINWIDIAHVHF